MAKSILVSLDLGKNELQNVRMQNLATAPSSPVEGQYYYDTGLDKPRIWNGGEWKDMVGADGTVTGVSGAAPITSTGGTSPQIGITAATTSAAGSMSAADKTKLDGIESGATADQTKADIDALGVDADTVDGAHAADLRARSTHTGTQAASTISDFAEASQDVVGGMVTGNTESGITVTYDDADGTLDFTVTDSPTVGGATPAQLRDRSTHTGTQALSTITGHDKAAHDALDIDADTVDGMDSTALVARANHTGTQALGTITGHDKAAHDALGIDAATTGGATASQLRDRSTHTGSQTASTISDFNTAVRTNRLNEMSAPNAAVAMNSQKITGLATPTAGTDAANKDYVDGVASGLDVKASVRAATTGNITLSGTQTIDGVSVVAGNRVLVKNQTTGSQNGIYVVAAGAWTRATDADSAAEVTPGMFTFVEQGTANGDTGWVLTNDGAITVGTTALTFAQFSGAGTYTAGNGLTLTGSSFAVTPAASGGISVAAGGVSVDPTIVARKFSATVGDGSATSFVLTHNLNTRAVLVSVYTNSGAYEEVMCDVEKTSVNTVTLRFATAPTAAQYAVAIIG